MHDHAGEAQGMKQNVMAKGVIKQVDRNKRWLKVEHQPIGAWNMGAMLMRFHLDDQVDIAGLKSGMSIHFHVSNPSVGKYLITEILTTEDY